MDKTAEVISQNKELTQALLDSNDIDSYCNEVETIRAKTDSLKKERNELREKLKKLEEEAKVRNKKARNLRKPKKEKYDDFENIQKRD